MTTHEADTYEFRLMVACNSASLHGFHELAAALHRILLKIRKGNP
jgi:hypothetical protein